MSRAALAIVHVAGVDVAETGVQRDRAARVSVAAGVAAMSVILKSGWNAVKCNGTSGPSSRMIHAHSARSSASDRSCPE
jgi:hypothetical protein